MQRIREESLRALPIRIRKATESDVAFIFNSWLKSYRDSGFGRAIMTTIFFSEHHKVLERILRTCDVYVACNDKDAAELYGWACGEFVDGIFVLHYIYVKHTYRLIGLGKLLLNQFKPDLNLGSIYTHKTEISRKLEAKFNMVYNPYIALTPDYRKGEEPKKSEEPKDGE